MSFISYSRIELTTAFTVTNKAAKTPPGCICAVDPRRLMAFSSRGYKGMYTRGTWWLNGVPGLPPSLSSRSAAPLSCHHSRRSLIAVPAFPESFRTTSSSNLIEFILIPAFDRYHSHARRSYVAIPVCRYSKLLIDHRIRLAKKLLSGILSGSGIYEALVIGGD